ncbi:MAG: hypothetical protein KGO02_08155 [Alphaproteobacteria bacterium]|nr:hypothetical protein [Alphaproteobacteria bacterium]
MSMLHIPASSEAEALVAAVVAVVSAGEKRARARGPKGTEKLIAAVAAIVGGVLVEALRRDRLVFRSLQKAAFDGERIGYLQAKPVFGGLVAVGLLHRHQGIRFQETEHFAETPSWSGMAARFEATEDLLRLAREHGIDKDNVESCFTKVFPTKPPKVKHAVTLRSVPERHPGQKRVNSDGELLPLDMEDNATREIVAVVEQANAVFARHRFENCTPPALYRAFREDFTLGGRWITAGAAPIQQMSADDRLKITIDGQPVAEIDVKASQLSILAAFAGMPCLGEADPYDFSDQLWARLPNARDIVKAVVVAALGAGRLPQRWPNKMKEKYGVPEELPVPVITQALAARFPFLECPGEVLGVAQEQVALRLQNLEAAALTAALHALWRNDIPGVPVHDSILVPNDTVVVTMAESELSRGYKERCGGAEIRTVVERLAREGY